MRKLKLGWIDRLFYSCYTKYEKSKFLSLTNLLLERDKENKRYDIPDVEESWKQFVEKYMK